MGEKLIGVREVAARLKRSRYAVNRYINFRGLPATKIGNSYAIDEDEFEAWRREVFPTIKMGRPFSTSNSTR